MKTKQKQKIHIKKINKISILMATKRKKQKKKNDWDISGNSSLGKDLEKNVKLKIRLSNQKVLKGSKIDINKYFFLTIQS